MELVTILWLVILLALALVGVVVVRRMSALVNRTRTLERFQASVESINLRFGTAAGPLVRGLDEARRHAADPSGLEERLATTQSVLEDLRLELQRLDPPRVASAAADGMRAELDRAIRATSLVEHGLGAMQGKSIGRDLEAQTSLKRGALNLRHAQDAFGLHARQVAGLRPADLAPPSGRPDGVVPASPPEGYGSEEAEDLQEGLNPRM